DDAVADEDELRILDLDLRHHTPSDRYVVAEGARRETLATHLEGGRAPRRDPDQWDTLHIAPIRVPRLQPQLPELLLQVRHRQLLASSARRTPLELVVREDGNMFQDAVGGDTFQGGACISGTAPV